MAMTARILSVSGLSVELKRDRRTIANALRTVPPDGAAPSGHPGWYVSTALDAMGRIRRAVSERDELIRAALGRLDDPAIVLEATGDADVDTMAEWVSKPREVVMSWIWAGLPYVSAGDIETGDGFVLRLGWTIDWWMPRLALATRTGDHDAIRRLGLD